MYLTQYLRDASDVFHKYLKILKKDFSFFEKRGIYLYIINYEWSKGVLNVIGDTFFIIMRGDMICQKN